jgi:hypothetical protein
MGKKWKQFFCCHIWKINKTEELRIENHPVYKSLDGKRLIKKYEVSALYKQCVKCELEAIEEQYVYIGDEIK